MSRMITLLFALTTLCSLPASAHHGWSEYDSSKELKLTGTIVESGYEHPHGHIRLVTPGKTWSAVLAPPSRMNARGLPPADLKKGTTVTVVGYPNRNKPDEMRAERIIVGNKTVELR
ncbi:MAG: DUF6152 family protein [Burkholderiales bacterium]|nr:DUF6152 family protein [Burkholderiales bacterium]